MKVNAISNGAELFLYGYIGWDVKASDFMKSLRDQENLYNEITLRINSGGGEVFEGLPMYNNIKSSKANITTMVDGLAASMASVIMCAGKKVKAASNAMIMVHGPKGGDYTNVENLETIVEYMKKMKADMAKIYSLKTGKSEEWVINNWLSDGKDHWFTAQEAKDIGLIDEIVLTNEDAPQATWAIKRIAAFYDEKLLNNPLTKNEPNMKKVIAVLNATGLVGTLNEAATEELVANGVQAITGALSAKDQEIATLKKKIGDMETASITEKQNALKVNATALVEGALSANKIVAAQKENYLALASASPESYASIKKIFDDTQAYKPVTQQLSAAADNELPKNLDKQKELFDKHIKEGTMSTLSAESVKTLWKAKHGKEISEATLKALSAQ